MSVLSVPSRAGAVRFLLDADATPGLLPRLLQPFAKRDLTPDHMWSRRSGDMMHVEIVLTDAPAGEIARIEGNLGQVVGVRRVLLVPESAAQAA